MKSVNDMYNDVNPADARMKNDLTSDTTIGGETKVMRDVNANKMGNDIGVNIKGLVVNSGKRKGNISTAIYGG